MFERYTMKARRAVFFARYEASQFGSPVIDAEHMRPPLHGRCRFARRVEKRQGGHFHVRLQPDRFNRDLHLQ
jgi:hypothetical protein